jgi:hypothetical protein
MTQYKVLETSLPINNQTYKLLNLTTNEVELWERNKIVRRFLPDQIIDITNDIVTFVS